MNKLSEAIRKKFKTQEKSWGTERCQSFYLKIEEIVTNYAQFFSTSPEEMFEILESKRTYSFPNYYQDSKFPALDDSVRIYETIDHLKQDIKIDLGFRCPSCSCVSKDPYECSVGPCDWRAYGLFKTMGKGLRIIVKDQFFKNPKVDEIFMPVSFESKKNHSP